MQITDLCKGGNLLTLFVISFFFLMLANPVSAIVYESMFDDPIGLGVYEYETILVSEGTSPSEIRYFYTDGSGSGETRITDIPAYAEDATIGADGDIFFVLSDGRVYRFFGTAGIVSFVDDYNTSFQLLGDVDTSTTDRSIFVDGDNHVYTNTGTSVYKFTYPSLSGSILYDFGYYVQSIAGHPDGLLVGGFSVTGNIPYIKIGVYSNGAVDSILSKSTKIGDYYGSGSPSAEQFGLYSTDNGDVYFSYYSTYWSTYGTPQFMPTSRFGWLNYSGSWGETVLTLVSPDDIYIDGAGIIYAAFSSDDTIKTYPTIGLQGGYSFYYYVGATGAQQLEYDTSTVNSVYAVYANDSIVEIAYNIDIDVSETSYSDPFGIGQYGGAVAVLEDFYWEIDLLNPSGMKIEDVSITNAIADDYGLFDYHVVVTGAKQLQSSLWENGTWTVNLYEKDRTTGLRSLLDTDTYVIVDNATSTYVTDVTPDVDPTLNPIDRINALLASNAFIGVLVMIACMGAFGRIGGTVGLVLGTVAGVSLASMLGYVPMWFVFVMVLALAVVFTSKIVSGLGGDK